MTVLAGVVLLGCRGQPPSRPVTGCVPGDPGPAQAIELSVSKKLPTGALLLDVRDRQTGAGLALVELRLLSLARTTHTDKKGKARFDSLPPGQHALATRRFGYSIRTDTVVVGQSAGQVARIALRRQTVCAYSTAALAPAPER
ncbi:MAG: carboxypeptidase regulatory-like domain-containing protein [Gemmatimonadaceae bacterium]|nr:carboxypeptidase regulatory-like domain-containing protein [Gemmatimonadaceae bacterium]